MKSASITDKVKLFVTYQAYAWVRLVLGATGSPQNVNVALGVDDQWLHAGQVEVNDDSWHLIYGSFRIKKPAGKVMVYIQGPAPGINFMVARDADELFKFCEDNNIGVRGHCIFWEVEDTVQDWVKSLGRNDLAVAVQNRLNGLLKRYKGKVRHYDVNNEMLHGSFYQDRLGKDIRANMFKEAKRLDPSAILFVNDYHVEDGCDPRSSPERYIDQILHLQEQGAPVEGIGIQGHIDSPVGSIVCSALDKLGITGLPIWFTELDVCSSNEHVRADDLEVMMREAFAHPSVEGIMLWGFWESFMSRENGHLVDAEGEVNEAGKRFIELKKEWLSDADGYINEQSEFSFRGFEGTYQVEIQNNIVKTFVVHKKQQQQQVVVVYVG